jgi:hypothetical protein
MKRLIVGLSLLLLSGNVRAEDKDDWFRANKSLDGHYGWNVWGFQADDPRIRGPHAAQPRPTCLIMSYSDAGAMHQPMPPVINIYFELRTGRLTFEVYPGHTVDRFFLKDKPKRGVAQSSDTALATMALTRTTNSSLPKL